MKIASVASVKARFSAYVKSTNRGPVVITRNGHAVAAIVPLADDQDVERVMMAYSPKLRGVFVAARRRIGAGQGVGHEKFWAQAASPPRAPRRRK